jgi:hypothetical protein
MIECAFWEICKRVGSDRKRESMKTQKLENSGSSRLASEEFWNRYLKEHQNPLNCWLHVFGTVASWVLLVSTILLKSWWLLALVPVVGYAPAWLGHLLVEGNKPVSIRYPLRSLLADYRLTLRMLIGQRPVKAASVNPELKTPQTSNHVSPGSGEGK